MSEKNIYPYNDIFPTIDENVFVAPGAKIIGDVVIGNESSVWFNVVIRGDVNYIRIGTRTNIQDCSMLHVTIEKFPLFVGNNVTVGHSVNLHGCVVKDFTLIGIGATILDGAVVDEYSMVGAGAVVTPGYVVPSGKLVAGIPAKVIRDLTKEEMEYFSISAERYLKYSELMRDSLNTNITT